MPIRKGPFDRIPLAKVKMTDSNPAGQDSDPDGIRLAPRRSLQKRTMVTAMLEAVEIVLFAADSAA